MAFYQQIHGKATGRKIADIVLGFFDGLKAEQVGKFIANIINNAFGLVAGFVEQMNKKDGWKKLGKWLSDSLEETFKNIDANTVADAIGGFIKGVLNLGITLLVNTNWYEVGMKIGQILGQIPWGQIALMVIGFINLAWVGVQGLLWGFITGIIAGAFKLAGEKIDEYKEKIPIAMENIIDTIHIELEKIKIVISAVWEKVKEWWNENVTPKLKAEYWQDKLQPIKDAIKTVFKGALNIVIDMINGMLATLEKGLNMIVRRINSMSIVNPFNGEDIWSPSVPLFKFDRIPRLARGGIVARPTQAIIGESGREAVMPLENNTEWMDILADKINGANNNITIRFTGSTAQLVRMLKPELEKEDKRTGKRLITGGAY